MPRRSDRNKHLQILVSNEAYDRLQQIAEAQGESLSDLVRESLKTYLEEHLEIRDVDLAIDHGGKRPGSGRKQESNTGQE